MGERPLPHELAFSFAEVVYMVVEMEYQQGQRDPNATMRRLKDLSAYSLEHADILNKRQGVELLALGMIFGMSSNPAYLNNQERLALLAPETFIYHGNAEKIAEEIAHDNRSNQMTSDKASNPLQPRLF